MEELSNEKLNEILKELNENCLAAFDEYMAKKTSQTSLPDAAEPVVDSETPTPTPTSNVDALNEALTSWKSLNVDKLNSSKIQSLFSLGELNKLNGERQASQQQRPGPNELKLKEILERTGYTHEVSSGQRKYGGPPPGWLVAPTEQAAEATIKPEESLKEEATESTVPAAPVVAKISAPVLPPTGCECFVGKLPRDLFEDELIPVFEKHGRIWDLRLMIDPNTGFSKGYCFVTYCEKENAQAAAKNVSFYMSHRIFYVTSGKLVYVLKLNDFEVRPGKEMRVNLSVANLKLFIGNIPRTKSKEELKQEFVKLVEGISDVIIYNQGEAENDKLKNRGFCFIEFIDHKSASMAKRKLSSSRFNRVFNREIAVDWADPNDEPDEETMAKVKVLYVKNLSAEVTEEEVQKLFEQYGKLERVRKMKDYAFVHFEQREDAVKAMEEQQAKVGPQILLT